MLTRRLFLRGLLGLASAPLVARLPIIEAPRRVWALGSGLTGGFLVPLEYRRDVVEFLRWCPPDSGGFLFPEKLLPKMLETARCIYDIRRVTD